MGTSPCHSFKWLWPKNHDDCVDDDNCNNNVGVDHDHDHDHDGDGDG